MYYACSVWSIPVFGSEYPNTDISRQKLSFLNNYFIKELPNCFPYLDNVIQTIEMLLDFRKAKVSQHPACLDHVIQTRKTITYFFSLMFRALTLRERETEERWPFVLFLSDEEKTLETIDFTIRIGKTPTFLYFDL